MWIHRCGDNMVHEEGNSDKNDHKSTKESIIKTTPFTVDYINNITKRSLDIRYEIENLIIKLLSCQDLIKKWIGLI